MVVDHPLAKVANGVHVVVDARDDEVGQFDPYACIVHGEDGVEHGGKMAAAALLVDVVAEGFDVDVGGIDEGDDVVQGFWADVSCCDEYVPQVVFVGESCDVGDVFDVGEWLSIGVGDAGALVLEADVDHLIGL